MVHRSSALAFLTQPIEDFTGPGTHVPLPSHPPPAQNELVTRLRARTFLVEMVYTEPHAGLPFLANRALFSACERGQSRVDEDGGSRKSAVGFFGARSRHAS